MVLLLNHFMAKEQEEQYTVDWKRLDNRTSSLFASFVNFEAERF